MKKNLLFLPSNMAAVQNLYTKFQKKYDKIFQALFDVK